MRHLLCCLLLISPLANAEIYRWTDAQGRVHFGEKPEAGAERITVRPQVVERDAATREREARAAKFYDARRQEQAVAAERAAEVREERQMRCSRLRDSQEQLDYPGPLYRLDERGERQYYTDEEIESVRKRVAASLARDCN